MFEATLEKAELLKKILDAVKELVTDANLDCSDEGLKLQAMDNSHVALVSLMLEKDAFAEFRCDRDMTLGMNLGSLQKIIKCANNDDNCKLSANEDADTLNLQFQGKRAARIGEYEMKLMDIDSEQLGIPETEYDAKISMPSGEFAKIMRDLKDLGESVRIEATSEGVKFTAEGEIGTGSVTVKPTGSGGFAGGNSKKNATKVKKEAGGKSSKTKSKKETDAMEEDEDGDEDVKPDVKDESDEEEDEDEDDAEDDEASGEDEEEGSGDEAPKKKKSTKSKSSSKKAGAGKGGAAKKGKKAVGGAEGEENRNVAISVNQSVSLNFSIKYLNNFAKSTPLASEVLLQMSNDVPLLVEYAWEGGSIKFYLAPKIAED
ncbi:MAG: proliferating cell nuclear antigen [Cyphobasidiales sp. Tagirdzhanova-0007]|nr:MAG: proliferating cell nuclear antigen [Cyphobasidiales sp. Tagirdzhanova-0007]